ncbi:MAG: ATP synthase F1 subunit epsilon [Candidatus Binataceae bacterium]
MAQSYRLRLITPTGVLFDGDVEEVTANGPLGQFGVLADHTNFITSLDPGLIEIRRPDGRRDYYLLSGGLAEVRFGAMTVLADEAEPPQAADEEALQRAALEAEAQLVQLSFYQHEYEETQHELALIRARQQASELKRTIH